MEQLVVDWSGNQSEAGSLSKWFITMQEAAPAADTPAPLGRHVGTTSVRTAHPKQHTVAAIRQHVHTQKQNRVGSHVTVIRGL